MPNPIAADNQRKFRQHPPNRPPANRLGIINDADFMIAPDGVGGVKQKYLYDGKVESNMLYVVKPIAPLF